MHINRYISIITVLIVFAVFLPGCANSDQKEKEEQEEALILQYLSDHGISNDTKTEGGIYFVEQVVGTGTSPVKDDFVIINYTGRNLETNEIHETTDESLKNEWPAYVYFSDYVFGPAKFAMGYSIAGVNEGLSLMKEGGKATLIMPSDKAFYDVPMVYDIELLKVIPDPEQYEDSVLNECRDYMQYGDTTFYNGIYYYEPVKGTGDPVNTSDTILFRFKGRIVDAYDAAIDTTRVFDENYDDEVPVKLIAGSSSPLSGNILDIPGGFITALDSMRKGSTAIVILPYTEAFDDDGLINSTYRYTIVPKYQTVVYDIRVEDIRPFAK